MKYFCSYIFLIFILFLCGCGGEGNVPAHKQEAVQYKNSSMEISKNIKSLDITADSANLKIYCWDKQEIKFEIKQIVRDNKLIVDLEKLLNKYYMTTKTEGNTLFFNVGFKGRIKKPEDIYSDIKLTVPRRMNNLKLSQKYGSFVVEDKFQGNIEADIDSGDTEIKAMEGELSYQCREGNIRLNSGKLLDNTKVDIKTGNIFIKTRCQEQGKYLFHTGTGNIDLSFPMESKIAFDSFGTVQNNQFTGVDGDIDIKVSSEIGKISINGY